ncbi:hypothetical protein Scep_009692 [Stephania cephalantha]|uniref:Uncharacterized protein n=1 Tax=Stephania cephalantha TaxID=152367 RepID=A0AAP0JU35_9MAGN
MRRDDIGVERKQINPDLPRLNELVSKSCVIFDGLILLEHQHGKPARLTNPLFSQNALFPAFDKLSSSTQNPFIRCKPQKKGKREEGEGKRRRKGNKEGKDHTHKRERGATGQTHATGAAPEAPPGKPRSGFLGEEERRREGSWQHLT